MGLLCCCFRPKLFKFKSGGKRIIDDRIGANEEAKETLNESHPNINSVHYRIPTVGLSEQNLFDITVQKMAAKMINISSLDDDFPQNFWRDRQKTYAKRVYSLKNPLPLSSQIPKRRRSESSHPKHLTAQERCARMETISREDLRLINKFSQRCSEAVDKGFKFWSEEPFVVEFNANLINA